MDEVDINKIKERSVKGVLALTTRSLLLQLISFIATFLLTVFLSPSAFGTFYVVSAFINFFTYFSDIGLAGALIQKKEEITSDDLKTTFTIQQILVGTLVLIGLIISPMFASFYKLDQSGLLLFQALIVSFFLSSLKTIPSVLLERRLNFNRLIIPQIAETLVFNLFAVVLAWKGFGITSFTVAVLGRGITGLIVMYIISPWPVSLGINKESSGKLLKFGLPFQANSILALLKDDLMTVYLGKILTFTEVGYVGWAQKWALLPLRSVMDNVIRVTFPAYARLQEDKELLKKAIEKSLFFVTLIVFPVLVTLAACAPLLVDLIPRYQKWQPALLSLYLFCINAAWGAVSTPLTNALNAIGKIKITLYLMILWTVLTWIITPLLVFSIGFSGVALSLALIPFTSFLTIYEVKKFVPLDITESVRGPFFASVFLGISLFTVKEKLPESSTGLILLLLTSAIIYPLALFTLQKDKLLREIKTVRGLLSVK